MASKKSTASEDEKKTTAKVSSKKKAVKKKTTPKTEDKAPTEKVAKKTTKKKTTKKASTKKVAKKKVSTAYEKLPASKIQVIGVGGSGKSATNYMIKKDARGVKFTVVNTDVQDLDQSKATRKIHIGKTLTGGVGTGMNPEVGKQAALETKEELISMLKESNIVFITGGMGGGTGTGATPVISAIAKELGILTVAVVTKPFFFEGNRRTMLAEQGIATLAQHVDAYIVIPNDKILEAADGDATMNEAFALSDDVLLQAVTGVSNLITTPGRINIDSSDIRTVLKDSGLALVGIGTARGEKRAEQAALAAINSPLLDISMSGAQAVLFSISAGDDLKMTEVATIASMITKEIADDAIVKFGTIRDLKLKKNEIKVTVVASGFDKKKPITNAPESVSEYGSTGMDYSDDIFDTKHDDVSLGDPTETIHIVDESLGNGFGEKQDIGIQEKDDEERVWSSVPGFLKKKK